MILGTVEEVEAKIEEVRNGSLLAQSFGATDWFGNYKYWPDGKIYYAYETNLSSQQRADLDRAIERWRDTTMLRFYPRGTGPRIVFRRATDSGDCSSEVGYPGAEGITFTNLGTRCGYPETLHEIGHAVALNHEHTRCDRDKYIVVYTSRMSGEGNNVSKNCSTGAQLSTYDPYSIMHYPKWAFARTPQAEDDCFNRDIDSACTILPKPGSGISRDRMGESEDLTSRDASGIFLYYRD